MPAGSQCAHVMVTWSRRTKYVTVLLWRLLRDETYQSSLRRLKPVRFGPLIRPRLARARQERPIQESVLMVIRKRRRVVHTSARTGFLASGKRHNRHPAQEAADSSAA